MRLICNGEVFSLTSVGRERDIQQTIEPKLAEIFGVDLDLLGSEITFPGDRKRLDTLAIDRKGHPVVIEYKKGHGDSQITQALDYRRVLRSPGGAQKLASLAHLRGHKVNDSIVRIILVAPWERPDLQQFAQDGVHLEWYEYSYFDNGCMVLRRRGEVSGESVERSKVEDKMVGADEFWNMLMSEVLKDDRFKGFRLVWGDYFRCWVIPNCLSYMFFLNKSGEKAMTYLDFRDSNRNGDSAREETLPQRTPRFEFLTKRDRFDLLQGDFKKVRPSKKSWGSILKEYRPGWKRDPKAQEELRDEMIADLKRLADWVEPYRDELRSLCGE